MGRQFLPHMVPQHRPTLLTLLESLEEDLEGEAGIPGTAHDVGRHGGLRRPPKKAARSTKKGKRKVLSTQEKEMSLVGRKLMDFPEGGKRSGRPRSYSEGDWGGDAKQEEHPYEGELALPSHFFSFFSPPSR